MTRRNNSPDLNAFHAQLDELVDTASGLATKVNTLGDVLSTADTDAEIHRVVGGLEVYLDDLLVQHSEVLRWRAVGSDARALDLLTGVYRHLLTETRDWLDELVETISDPVAAIKRQGLPSSGTVNLQLTLTLTEAPQLAALYRWVERNHQPAGKSNRGFLGTVGAVVVGIAVGDWLFGDGE